MVVTGEEGVAVASLYERLGGLDAMAAVGESFIARCAP